MTAFFIPGLVETERVTEDTYLQMRRGVELDTGSRPNDRRIRQLLSRRAGSDCVTEVGMPDPVHGRTVMAIFDLGPHRPFVVDCEPHAGVDGAVREVLSCHAYSVMEFES
jgi:hypothetical protein